MFLDTTNAHNQSEKQFLQELLKEISKRND